MLGKVRATEKTVFEGPAGERLLLMAALQTIVVETMARRASDADVGEINRKLGSKHPYRGLRGIAH